jgi:hypothetical protein
MNTNALINYDTACRAIRLAAKVDEVLNIRDQAEAIKAYAHQAKNTELEVQSTEIALRAERRLGEILIKRKQDKDDFVALAREAFEPGEKKPCEVCNKYQSLTHAHHIVPLSIQARSIPDIPNQSFVWLCPTHHAAVHILVGQMDSKSGKPSKSCINVISDLSDEGIFKQVWEIALEAWK